MAGPRYNRWPNLVRNILMLAWSGYIGYWIVSMARAMGHPPGIVFIPFLILGWMTGLGIIALIWVGLNKLARRMGNIAACRTCGYDLRGSIDACIDRCPECGVVITYDQTDEWRLRERKPNQQHPPTQRT